MTADETDRALITRREAIRRVSALFGGVALVGQAAMLTVPARSAARTAPFDAPVPFDAPALFDAAAIALLDEIAETILPATDTPGAKAAGVGAFMAVMVTDTYAAGEQNIFQAGLATLDTRCRESFGRGFLAANADERLRLLEALDAEQFDYMGQKAGSAPAHFFRMMKELALLGYFTSEIGYTKAMRYLETPGRYDPCVPFKPGEKAWAPHA